MLTICRAQTPLGLVLLTCTAEALVCLRFVDEPCDAPWMDALAETPAPMRQAQQWLAAYFAGEPLPPLPPLQPTGTPFAQQVWAALQAIPFGQTATYGELAHVVAQRLGKPRMSAQAVGGAAGRNPIALCIPCHRLVGADGALTGYRWGLWRKQALLHMERQHTPPAMLE